MDFIEWDERAITNHVGMDKEHKKMVDDTNKLYDLVMGNKKDRANKLLNKILDDFKIHFESEDLLMKKSKIPSYISHKLEHERFYNKIRDLKIRIESGKESLSVTHLKIVKIWFFKKKTAYI